jgi:hypothetical protein
MLSFNHCVETIGSIARVGGVGGVDRVQATHKGNATIAKTIMPDNNFFFICFTSFQRLLQTGLGREISHISSPLSIMISELTP